MNVSGLPSVTLTDTQVKDSSAAKPIIQSNSELHSATVSDPHNTEHLNKIDIDITGYNYPFATDTVNTSENRREMLLQSLNMLSVEIPEAGRRLFDQVQSMEKEIEAKIPALKYIEWDFSLNADNQFALTDNTNLSDSDKKLFEEELNSGWGSHRAATFRDALIEAMHLGRGPNQYEPTNMYKFDLSADNFDQVIRFRELASNSFNKYDQFHKGMALESIADQLFARADDIYSQRIEIKI